MAALTYTDLVGKFPELATSDADQLTRIGDYLDEAEMVIGNVFRTAERRDKARLLYAAHRVSRYGCKGEAKGAGALTGRTRGSRSVSYAAPAQEASGLSDLSASEYGRRLQTLLRGSRYRRPVKV